MGSLHWGVFGGSARCRWISPALFGTHSELPVLQPHFTQITDGLLFHSSALGVRLWRAHQFLSVHEPGLSPWIELSTILNHVTRLEVDIRKTPAWATLSRGKLRSA